MGRLVSPVKSISSLVFRPIPTRPFKADKAVRVEGVILIVSGSRLFTNVSMAGAWPIGYRSYVVYKILDALGRLKVVPGEDLDKHYDALAEDEKADEQKQDAKSIVDLQAKYGLKLSKSQFKVLSKKVGVSVDDLVHKS